MWTATVSRKRCSSRDGTLRVYDAMTGAARWEERLDAWGTLIAADVDGNGADEILFSSEKGRLLCLENRAAPGTGSHVRWANELDGIPGQAIFADVDGDRLGEILSVSDGFSIA